MLLLFNANLICFLLKINTIKLPGISAYCPKKVKKSRGRQFQETYLNIRKQSVPLIIKTEQEAIISRLLLCLGLSILYCSFVSTHSR